jgi:Chlorophyll A-B binding protein
MSNTPEKKTPEKKTATSQNLAEPSFGFNFYSERLNGRFAMLGILGILLLEVFSGQGLLSWLGLH